jgi:hypothetical protein
VESTATTASTKSSAMDVTTKARVPTGGMIPCPASMIEAAERAGVRARPMLEAPMLEAAVIETCMTGLSMTESMVNERSAVGDKDGVAEDHASTEPVATPKRPSPTPTAEKPNAVPHAEVNPRVSDKDSRDRGPRGIRSDRRPIDEPWVVCRHIDDIGIGWLHDDALALGRHGLLGVALQVARLLGSLSHGLHCVEHILRLVDIGISKR